MVYDIAVVGAGPAGLSAAINARARNKQVLLVGNDYRDSPLYRAGQIDNYLSLPGVTGPGFLDTGRKQAEDMEVAFQTGRVQSILPGKAECYLSIGAEVTQARAVILATGVARGQKLPGEAEFLGRGVSYCATCDGMLYKGKRVVVVGAAPNAVEEAAFLHELGCQVTYVAPKRPEQLPDAIAFSAQGKLAVLGETKVHALDNAGAQLPCDCVFILRQSIAPADLVPGLATEEGYIAVDRQMQTNLPGVFAAGDCVGTPLQLAKAVGDGLVAGQRASEYVDGLK